MSLLFSIIAANISNAHQDLGLGKTRHTHSIICKALSAAVAVVFPLEFLEPAVVVLASGHREHASRVGCFVDVFAYGFVAL